jgi:hypothetical protein
MRLGGDRSALVGIEVSQQRIRVHRRHCTG